MVFSSARSSTGFWARGRSSGRALPTRALVTACLLALGGCFTESDTDDDDVPSDTTGNTTDPTLTTTSDPSFTTSVTTAMTASSDPTTQTDPSVDSSGTTDSDSDPSTTTDTTGGECLGEGMAVCDDGMAVIGELCFLAPAAIDGGSEQIGALAIADIDDDGAPDVAFTDGADGYVAFAADGDLQTATPIAGMVATWSVDVGPLAGQMAVAFGAANAAVYIARWDGLAFVLDPPIGAPGEFVTARFGDFDGDNALDLLVGAEGAAALFLFTNDGDGTFGGPGTIDLGAISGVADLRVLHHDDFDIPGIAVLTREGRLLWIAPADGALGNVLEIDPAQTYGDPTTGRLAAGDLDADGDTDLAVGFEGRAFVFRATALPGFEPSQPLGTGMTGTVTPIFADIDNDARPDVVVADVPQSSIELFVADGEDFVHADPIQVPPGPRGVGVADFNSDCAADIVALGPAWLRVIDANP